jgi:hypothetical protein
MRADLQHQNSPKYVTCTHLEFYAAGIVVYYRRFSITYQFHLRQSKPAWPLKMKAISCPETSVINHHPTLRKIANGADIIYTAVENWNHQNIFLKQKEGG